jgi:hypothetical protein
VFSAEYEVNFQRERFVTAEVEEMEGKVNNREV